MRSRYFLPAGAAILIAAMLFYFARPALSYYFSADDVMNIRRAWTSPPGALIRDMFTFSADAYRPLGLLWYRIVFALGGLYPAPFQWASFAFVVLNVGLLFVLAKMLTGSNEVAVLAALLGCFHSRMESLYFSGGTIYDVLCYTFFYSALIVYIRVRGPLGMTAFLLLQLLALNAKEMAVTLPVVVLGYELIYHRTFNLLREGRLVGASGLMTVIFYVRKFTGSSLLTSSYRPQYSLGRLIENWRIYLGDLFYRHGALSAWLVVLIWAALVLAALTLKSKALKFCCVLILVTPLPVCFIEQRGLNMFYIPLTGWVIYAAWLLVRARERLRLQPGVLFVTTAIVIELAHAHDRPNRFTFPDVKGDMIRDFKEQFAELHPRFTGSPNILLLDDPFDAVEWTPISLLQLYYRQPDLSVLRMKMADQHAPIAETKFDLVFTYRDRRLIEVKPDQSIR